MAQSTSGTILGIVAPMTGATSGVAGTAGSVPVPAAGKQTSFLRGDGTFASVKTIGSGSPNAVVTGNIGDMFYDSTNSVEYVKTSGANTNTGWVVEGGVVAGGGTGVTTLTAFAPVFGGTTATGPVQSGTTGTAGQMLTSNGAGVLPTFQSVQYANITRASPGATIFTIPATAGSGDNFTLDPVANAFPFSTTSTLNNSSSTAGFTIGASSITVNAAGAGTLRIDVHAALPNTIGNRIYLELVKNGATVIAGGHQYATGGGGDLPSISYVGSFVATDTIDIRAHCGPSPAAIPITAYSISVVRL